jgi:ABC-type transporter Mla maintaining outer membrane lipid asymmetry permease subunit MlaE
MVSAAESSYSLKLQGENIVKQRPMAVTILAIVALIAGVIVLLEALLFFGVALFGLLRLDFFGVAWLGGILSLIVALIWLSTARQLFVLDPRGWTFVIVISILTLIINVIGLLGGNSFNSIWWSFIAPVLALVLGFLPGTRAAFGQK